MSPHRLVHRARRAPWATIGFLILFVALSIVVYRLEGLARQGAQAHDANCALRADLQGRVDASRVFLDMTLAERINQYGPVLGSIDPEIVRSKLPDQQRSLDALAVLDCPAPKP